MATCGCSSSLYSWGGGGGVLGGSEEEDWNPGPTGEFCDPNALIMLLYDDIDGHTDDDIALLLSSRGRWRGGRREPRRAEERRRERGRNGEEQRTEVSREEEQRTERERQRTGENRGEEQRGGESRGKERRTNTESHEERKRTDIKSQKQERMEESRGEGQRTGSELRRMEESCVGDTTRTERERQRSEKRRGEQQTTIGGEVSNSSEGSTFHENTGRAAETSDDNGVRLRENGGAATQQHTPNRASRGSKSPVGNDKSSRRRLPVRELLLEELPALERASRLADSCVCHDPAELALESGSEWAELRPEVWLSVDEDGSVHEIGEVCCSVSGR